MRFLAAVLALSFCVIASAQDFTKPVTYTARAIPLRLVLDALIKQGGVKLKVTADMEEEPLILKVKDVPLKSVMDKMADVFAADWVDHNGFWRLERSEEKIAKLKESIILARTKAIEHSFEELRASEAKYPALTSTSSDLLVGSLYSSAKKYQAGESVDDTASLDLYAQTPIARFTRRVLLAMDPRELASIPIGHRAVFSTKPNAVQQGLPEGTTALFKQFDNDFALFNESLQKVVPANERGLMAGFSMVSKKPVARVIISNQPFPGDETLSLEIRLVDENGDEIVEGSQNLGTTIEDWVGGQYDYAKLRQEAQKTGFELGPIAKEIAPHTGPASNNLRVLPKEVVDILLDPVRHDPLSIATSDLLIGAADLEKENLIALPSDNCEYYALNSSRMGKTSLAAFRAVAERQANVSIESGDGWLVVKPHDPVATALERIPRAALQTFLTDVVTQGYISLDSAANLLASGSMELRDDLATREAGYLHPGAESHALGGMPGMVRFFGALSDQQRDGASRGTLKLHMSDFDNDQRAIATSMVYDAFNQMQQFYEQPDPSLSSNPHLIDRTDFLPDGLTTDMVVEVSDASTSAAFVDQTQYSGGNYVSAIPQDVLAQFLAQSEHPDLFPITNPSKINGLKGGTQRRVTITLKQGNKVISQSINEDHPSDGMMMTIDQYIASLPKDDREKLEAAIATIVSRMQQMHRNPVNNAPAPTQGGQKPPTQEAA